jgi:indole-3-glycerol phosphate synthase
MSFGHMNILDTIVAQKRIEILGLPKRKVSAAELRAAVQARGEERNFEAALRHPKIGPIALIAEVKKASPSAGVICSDFDPVRIAKAYERAGASCLSVLTDQQFFQGSLAYLRQIRNVVRLPLLRKDFILDELQVWEAVEWGADAILLIVSILTDQKLRELHALITGGGLSALVEVHDEEELERALAAGARLIGVNNRDLKTFEVDLATTERLIARLGQSSKVGNSDEIILVAESGIHTRADVERLRHCGVRAALVGETLMRQRDILSKVSELFAI